MYYLITLRSMNLTQDETRIQVHANAITAVGHACLEMYTMRKSVREPLQPEWKVLDRDGSRPCAPCDRGGYTMKRKAGASRVWRVHQDPPPAVNSESGQTRMHDGWPMSA